MGFGHRVYKNYDPRAKLVKESADAVLADLGVKDPLLDIAKELEQIALEDSYFQERRLYPNVDFYTGVIYKAMGFPTRMFTVLFASAPAFGSALGLPPSHCIDEMQEKQRSGGCGSP